MDRLLITLVLQFFVVVYGKPTPEEIQRVFSANFQSQPKDTTNCPYNLCNYTATYNENELKSIVSKYKEYLPLFGNVLDVNRTEPTDTIADRYGDDQKSNMCKTKSVTMFPKQGRTVNMELKNIVNVEGYHQMVTFEACEDRTECYASAHYLPLGISSSCETQYIVIRLVVINENNTLGLERFAIPSGCSCMYTPIRYD